MGIDVVTGATGHLGNVLVRELLERGSTVRAVVQPGDDAAALAALPVKTIHADIRDRAALRKAFTGATRVFHLASVASSSWPQRARVHEVNVGGTQAVLSACQGAWVSRLVHLGSVHALAEPSSGVLDETTGFDPNKVNGAYAKTTAAACAQVQQVARDGDVDAVIVLPTGVVGPLDVRTSEMGQLLLDLEAGRVPFLLSGGHDWIDVRYVARGAVLAAERGQSGEAYLLGSERLTLFDIAEMVSRETGAPLPKLLPAWLARALALPGPLLEAFTQRRALFTSYAVHALTIPFTVSHEKARQALGLIPGPVRQALRDALSWHRANRGR
jgi:dihydroflavonol-4-reductase